MKVWVVALLLCPSSTHPPWLSGPEHFHSEFRVPVETGPGLPWDQVFRAGALEPSIWGPQREVVKGERCEKSD